MMNGELGVHMEYVSVYFTHPCRVKSLKRAEISAVINTARKSLFDLPFHLDGRYTIYAIWILLICQMAACKRAFMCNTTSANVLEF